MITRLEHEALWVGDALVTVTKIDHNKVRIGVTADREIKVLRKELCPDRPAPDGHKIQLARTGRTMVASIQDFLAGRDALDQPTLMALELLHGKLLAMERADQPKKVLDKLPIGG